LPNLPVGTRKTAHTPEMLVYVSTILSLQKNCSGFFPRNGATEAILITSITPNVGHCDFSIRTNCWPRFVERAIHCMCCHATRVAGNLRHFHLIAGFATRHALASSRLFPSLVPSSIDGPARARTRDGVRSRLPRARGLLVPDRSSRSPQ